MLATTPNKLVRLYSCDGKVFVVENEVLEMCATLRSIIRGKTAFKNGLGGLFSVDNGFVVLKSEGKVLASIVKNTPEEVYLSFPDVKAEVLERVFEYCRYQGLGNTDREKRTWEAEYVQVKQGLLCEVASAAYYLDIKPLVNLTSRAIASQISTKTSEELRETFSNVNCDLYVPMFATRCRLHRKMVQKKSGKPQQLTDSTMDGAVIYSHPPACSHPPNAPHTIDCCTLPLPPSAFSSSSSSSSPSSSSCCPSCSGSFSSSSSISLSSFSYSSSTPVTPPSAENDPRSLDELLEFIGGDEKNTKKPKKKTNKKKKKEEPKKEKVEPESMPVTKDTQDTHTEDIGDEEETDELSPEVQAEIDREVEEFRLRLESMSCNKRTIPKITLPSAISASLSSLQEELCILVNMLEKQLSQF